MRHQPNFAASRRVSDLASRRISARILSLPESTFLARVVTSMDQEAAKAGVEDAIEIDLRQPGLAAFLARLWPGAGHVYQGRYPKAALFMSCILALYVYGLFLGDGHVVYASWTDDDKRWQYLCQLGIGLPSLPALLQNRRVMAGQPPLLDGLMAPPEQPVLPEGEDELARWHERLASKFDLGTLYTMIAGLLNILAVCDAYAGPFVPSSEDEQDAKKKKSSPDA